MTLSTQLIATVTIGAFHSNAAPLSSRLFSALSKLSMKSLTAATGPLAKSTASCLNSSKLNWPSRSLSNVPMMVVGSVSGGEVDSGQVKVLYFKLRTRGPELIGSLKLGNVWVFVQLIHRPRRTKNQLYKKPNIAYQLC